MTQDGLWAVVVALLGVIVAVGGSYLSFRQQTSSLRSSIKEQRSALRISWTSNVVSWGQCCLRTLSEGDALLRDNSTTRRSNFDEDLHRVLHLLSSLIDEVRLFFINIKYGSYGHEKPSAYRGLSPKLIDCLKLAYLTIENLKENENNQEIRAKLIEFRREFVSELQREIDPDWVHKAVHYDEGAAN